LSVHTTASSRCSGRRLRPAVGGVVRRGAAALVLGVGTAARRRVCDQCRRCALSRGGLAARAAAEAPAPEALLHRSLVSLAGAAARGAAARLELRPEALSDELLASGAASVDLRWCGSADALAQFGVRPQAEGGATVEDALRLLNPSSQSTSTTQAGKVLFWGCLVLDVLWPCRDVAADAVIAASKNLLRLDDGLALKDVPLSDKDWMNAVRDECRPRLLGDIAVAHTLNTASEVEELFGRRRSRPPLLTLHAGAAFGFGDHPTTRLCANWLLRDNSRLAGASVLDYGCGTGVLALGARLLGASSAAGVDCDLTSLLLARSNAELNGLSLQLYVSDDAERGDWPCVSFYSPSTSARGVAPFPTGPPEDRRFEIVVANMTSGPLIRLAPRLARALAPGGRLALSGTQRDKAPLVCEAYAAEGLCLKFGGGEEEWVLLANDV